jgi:hypothetical protein
MSMLVKRTFLQYAQGVQIFSSGELELLGYKKNRNFFQSGIPQRYSALFILGSFGL